MVWSRPTIEGLMGMLNGKESTMTGKTKVKAGRATCGRPAAAPPGSAAHMIPKPRLIFFGTGNPAPWNSHMRPGDNKWSCSRLALDPETGEIKWGFQTTPNDGWDFDGVNEFDPFDARR